MPKRLTPRFVTTVLTKLPSSSPSDVVVKVSESHFERLWGNEGQAVVTRVVATTKGGTELRMIAKRFAVSEPRQRGRRKRKRGGSSSADGPSMLMSGVPSNDTEREAAYKLRVRCRSFVAEAAFLRLLRAPFGAVGEHTAATTATDDDITAATTATAAITTVAERLEGLGASVPAVFHVHAASPPAVSLARDTSSGDLDPTTDPTDRGPTLDDVAPVLWEQPSCPARFDFLMEDLEWRGTVGAEQQYTLLPHHARAAVRWLAGFHATFSRRASLGGAASIRLPPELWAQGNYVSRRTHQRQRCEAVSLPPPLLPPHFICALTIHSPFSYLSTFRPPWPSGASSGTLRAPSSRGRRLG